MAVPAATLYFSTTYSDFSAHSAQVQCGLMHGACWSITRLYLNFCKNKRHHCIHQSVLGRQRVLPPAVTGSPLSPSSSGKPVESEHTAGVPTTAQTPQAQLHGGRFHKSYSGAISHHRRTRVVSGTMPEKSVDYGGTWCMGNCGGEKLSTHDDLSVGSGPFALYPGAHMHE